VLRSDYTETLPLIEMAEKLCEPLKDDQEGLSRESDDFKEEFAGLLRSFYFQRGALAHHINKPQMALANCLEYKRLLQKDLGSMEDQHTGVAWNELGVAYLQNGDVKSSHGCFRNSIAIMERLPGVTTNTRSMPLINMGFALWISGEHDQAAAIFEQALALREIAYGKDDTESFA
jgi:tetratricopeptide (TPR) repeat protein